MQEFGAYFADRGRMSPPANFEGRTYRFDESNAPISNLMTNTPVFGEFLAGGPPFDTVTTSETERFPDQPPSTGHNDLEANDQRFQRTPYLSTEWNARRGEVLLLFLPS